MGAFGLGWASTRAGEALRIGWPGDTVFEVGHAFLAEAIVHAGKGLVEDDKIRALDERAEEQEHFLRGVWNVAEGELICPVEIGR